MVSYAHTRARETDEICSVDAPYICTKAQQQKYGPLLQQVP